MTRYISHAGVVADEPHEPHDEIEKHVQLGTDPSEKSSRKLLTDEADIDAVWVGATTVEQFKADIETLREAGWPTDGA